MRDPYHLVNLCEDSFNNKIKFVHGFNRIGNMHVIAGGLKLHLDCLGEQIMR